MNFSSVSRSEKRNFLSGMNVTFLLIMINIISFILFSLLISLKIIPVDFIAIKPANIFQGKYFWTFITSIFMHGGLFHIFANMLSLLFVGTLTERILGPKRYFLFYMVSGIFAGVFFVLSSLLFIADFNTFAVGASGALFGVVGLLVFLTPNLPVYVMFIPIPIKMKYAAPGILIVLWFISLAGNVPIGNTAHLGGLLAGIIYGAYLRYRFPNKIRKLNRIFS